MKLLPKERPRYRLHDKIIQHDHWHLTTVQYSTSRALHQTPGYPQIQQYRCGQLRTTRV